MSSMNQNLNNLVKEAQKMQKKMQEAQDELSNIIVEGKAGGNLVFIRMNGRYEVLEVFIDPTMMEENETIIADLVKAAFNDAIRKVEKISKEKIANLTSGLNIPTDLLTDDDN